MFGHVVWERQLDEDPVDGWVGVQGCEAREEFGFGGGLVELFDLAREAGLEVIVGDVNGGSGWKTEDGSVRRMDGWTYLLGCFLLHPHICGCSGRGGGVEVVSIREGEKSGGERSWSLMTYWNRSGFRL